MLRIATLLILGALPATAAGALSYSRDVRPILSKNCFACHGPDEKKRKSDIRLDVAGDAGPGEFVTRIVSHDPDEIMPPPESNKTLEPGQIAVLKEWIARGAPYEPHWAFVEPKKSSPPADAHPVDHFIDQRLDFESHSRSPQADPFTLIRRVHLDLTGLPPTPEEADAFAADPSPQAYAAIVDRLLASPRYGERWARRWLDLARYADTNGYEKDRDRSIWPYRDWVIRALNADMPFDRFTIEQLAGDMIPGATPDQILATGFHRNTMLNEEGGIDPLEFRFHAMTDRVGTTGTTWLGLTTSCAQCHTHKYDPITHQDYYGMMAFLNNTDEPDYHLPVQDTETRQAKNLAEAARILDALPGQWPAKDGEPTFDQALASWIEAQRASLTDWQIITPQTMSANVPYLMQEEDGVIFAAGDTSKHDIYTLEFPGNDRPVTTLRLEALPDSRLPGTGPGLAYFEGPKGDFFLSEIRIETSDGTALQIAGTSETVSGNSFGSNPAAAAQAIDGDIQTGWSDGKINGKRQVAVFHFADPLPAGTAFTIRMDFSRHYPCALGKFRFSVANTAPTVRATALSEETLSTLARSDAASHSAVREAFLMQAAPFSKQTARINQLRAPVRGTPTLVMRERPAKHPRPTFLHHRGEYTQPKERVEPRIPEALLAPGTPTPANRLQFAQWIVSPDNPLTARVIVNRHWAAFFGTGIVKTLDDFGMQGDLPSHPELLDHLAVTFMENDWSLKSLHRLIVTSGTYQQASTVPSDPADPRLLGHFPRNRLEAEIIRDSALAASGLLHDKMFGPPVRPPQPAAARGADYGKSQWKASSGADRHRRSVYTYQKRTAPFAMFTTFDAGSGEACIARRDVSNTPLQALTLLNDPMFIEIAQTYGKLIEAAPGDTDDRITFAFRRLLTRPPAPDELELLREFHAKHKDWSALARALLSLDEAITKN